MENSFRLVLIILSALVITGIFIHGLWTIRKNKKNPYKLKATEDRVEPENRDFDRSGFDQDGVGKAKVVGKNDQFQESDIQVEANVNVGESSVLDEQVEVDINETDSINTQEPTLDLNSIDIEPDVAPEPELKPAATYEAPVSQPKTRKKPQPKIKVDQMDLEFGDPIDVGSVKKTPEISQSEVEEEVLILSVVAPQGEPISGASLLPNLLTLGMRFGEMDIFHRHQDSAGNGLITFSCANMMQPGTFNIDNMENFTTQGISFFMQLPNAEDPFTVFNQMLAAAKQLATEYHGQVLDGQRSVMTKQTEKHYISLIREFERKSRIASF